MGSSSSSSKSAAKYRSGSNAAPAKMSSTATETKETKPAFSNEQCLFEAEKHLTKLLVSHGPVTLVLDYLRHPCSFDPNWTSPHLLCLPEQYKVLPWHVSQKTPGDNYGISFLSFWFNSGHFRWAIKLVGDPKYCYFGFACMHPEGLDFAGTETLNNADIVKNCIIYEFDGDLRDSTGERHFGPALQIGDVLDVEINAPASNIGSDGKFTILHPCTVTYGINGKIAGSPISWMPSGLPIVPVVSLGQRSAHVELLPDQCLLNGVLVEPLPPPTLREEHAKALAEMKAAAKKLEEQQKAGAAGAAAAPVMPTQGGPHRHPLIGEGEQS